MSRNFIGRVNVILFALLCALGAVVGGFIALIFIALLQGNERPAELPSYALVIVLIGLLGPVAWLILKRRQSRAPTRIESAAVTSSISGYGASQKQLFALPERWRTTIIAAGCVVLCIALLIQFSGGGFQELPDCGSSYAKAGLKSTIEDSPFLAPGLKIFTIREVQQCGVQEDQNANVTVRACRAVLFTNAGETPAHFHIRWIDKKEGQVFLEINPCPLFGTSAGDLGWKKQPTPRRTASSPQ